MSKPMKKEYAERIKPLFDQSGLTPEQLAKAIGATVRDIYHWNNDGYGTYAKFWHEIADLFHVSVSYLKMETDEKYPASSVSGGNETKYREFLMALCGDDQEKLRRLQDALAKNPEKTKASFDLFLKTL